MKNSIPKFRTEEEEREYWASHDSVGRVDWKKAKEAVFSKLRPSVRSISLRLPESMLGRGASGDSVGRSTARRRRSR